MKYSQATLKHYLKGLASPDAVPGGGSASAAVVSLGIGLGEMVCGVLMKRKIPLKTKSQIEKYLIELRKIRVLTTEVIDEDPKVFQDLMQAYQTKKTAEEKRQYIDQHLESAFEVMFDLSRLASLANKSVAGLDKFATKSIKSDLKLAKYFLKAGFQGAKQTAKINVDCLHSLKLKKKLSLKLNKQTF